MLSRQLSVLAMCLMLSCAAGCAFGDRRSTLTYTAGDVRKELSAAPGSRGTISIQRFADERAEKLNIGEVRNGYGMKTASVLAKNDVTQWVTDAIRAELTLAGYRVVDGPSSSASLSGKVITVYCTALFAYEAEVSFFAKVNRGGAEVLNRRYTGKASGGLNWAASETGYAWSLELALRQAIGQLLTDITSADFK